MSRRFGNTVNVQQRQVLGELRPVLGALQTKQALLKPTQQQQPQQHGLKTRTVASNVHDQENEGIQAKKDKAEVKKFFNNDVSLVDEGVCSQEASTHEVSMISQDDLLDESYEAMKKNINSILIQSDEKSEDKENDFSMMEDISLETAQDVSSSEMEHSDCSVIPPTSSAFSHFDLLSDFSTEILSYLLEKERLHLADPFYMSKQPHINRQMRSILVDWLVDVTEEYNLHEETLFLAVQYIDRFLSRASTSRQELQLLGTAALFIASKYEEIYPPELREFVYTTDDSFSKTQILAMEKNILRVLQFDVSAPTSLYFLKKYATDLNATKDEYFFAKYLCCTSLLESSFLKYYPSEIGLSCLLLAFKAFDRDICPNFLSTTLNFERSLGTNGDVLDLLEQRNSLIESLTKLHDNAAELKQQAIYKKFSSSRFHKVAQKSLH